MCFSATASFASSAGLGVIGVATFRAANKKQKMLAAIPLLFAVQQAIEGFQWLCVSSGSTSVALGYGFMFFAFLLWPVYIPTTVFLLDEKRRDILRWLIYIGAGISFFLLGVLIVEPLTVQVFNRSLFYQINTPFNIWFTLIYAAVVCGALLVSSKAAFRWFGLAGFVAAAFAAYLSFQTFTSVWCFFAAILSSLIYFYVKSQKPVVKKIADKKK